MSNGCTHARTYAHTHTRMCQLNGSCVFFCVCCFLSEGAAATERFNYWAATLLYQRTLAQIQCQWGLLNGVLAAIEKLPA